MPRSKFDRDYDWVNTLLKRCIHGEGSLTDKEIEDLFTFFRKFWSTDCKDAVCRVKTCRLAAPSKGWVLYEGFPSLCDLIIDFLKNNFNLKGSTGDALDAELLRLPIDGFGSQ